MPAFETFHNFYLLGYLVLCLIETVSLWRSGVRLLGLRSFLPLLMDNTTDGSLAQLDADRKRIDKLARLIILRKGLILQFENQEYIIDWLDTNHIEHGVAHRHFRNVIDKLSEDPLLSLRAASDQLQ